MSPGLYLVTRTASLEGGVDSAFLEFPLHWTKDHDLSHETVLDSSGDSWELTDDLKQGLWEFCPHLKEVYGSARQCQRLREAAALLTLEASSAWLEEGSSHLLSAPLEQD